MLNTYDGLTPEQRVDLVAPDASPRLREYLVSVIRPVAPGPLSSPDASRACRCRRGCCDVCQGRRRATSPQDAQNPGGGVERRVDDSGSTQADFSQTPHAESSTYTTPRRGFRHGRASHRNPGGRPRKHGTAADRQRTYREKKKLAQIAANDAVLAGAGA